MTNLFIVSGGQTGVDRGALDAAIEVNSPCGGWCPEGRLAEDGTIPMRYPLTDLPGGYLKRTRKNVEDSDGTLILTFGEATGGTARTIEVCQRIGRPHLVIDAGVTAMASAEQAVREFVRKHAITRLNVAGPRASKESRGYGYAHELVGKLILSSQ
jgi:hypothetical protein